MAFPGIITIEDSQRTYLVVGLPDLLPPASNLIGSEKLPAWACSPSSSSPPASDESSDSTDPWSNVTRRCSSRQLKHKLFPFFYYLNFLDDTLRWISVVAVPSLIYKGIFWLFQPSQTRVIFQECMTRCCGGDHLKELQGRKEWYTSCNCAWEQLRRLLRR